MEVFAVFMLMLGCPDDLRSCEEIPAPQVAYHSVDECNFALEEELVRAGRENPLVVGKCIEFDHSLLEANAEIVWDINPDGELIAGVVAQTPDEMTDAIVAANPDLLEKPIELANAE